MVDSSTETASTETKRRRSKADTERVGRQYFEAIAQRDVEAAVALWIEGGREFVRGQIDTTAPEGVRVFLRGLFASFPDLEFDVVEVVADVERCVVRWSATGTFTGPDSFNGFAPNDSRLMLEGVDVLHIQDGLIASNDAYIDGLGFARQIGMLPSQGSGTEQGLARVFNAKTAVARRFSGAGGAAEPVAEGVWLVRGGFPGKTMNVFLIRDGDGVMLFDAGVKGMVRQLASIGASLGGITRIVLGHSHADHRGAAPGLHVPVLCHEAERADAEGDGGDHYFDLTQLNRAGMVAFPRLLASWDGGPVQIAETLVGGDEIAGFRVVHLPGHAPGLIALWRESDRLALTSDIFYTLDPQTGRKGGPRVPNSAFNQDTEQARESIRTLAALEPQAAWPGHADPLRGEVREQLERAAEST